MNRNSKLIKRGLTTSLAVGMSVMVGAMPVYAASSDKKDNDDKLYKEETVYVNADASGNTDEITVSNWLKNSGDVSGKLTDKNVEVNGKTENMYTAFVMMTGMILPNDNFTNVTIDNGKVISDGNRSIVVGFGMPGLKESLNLDDIKDADDLTIPESL